MSRSSHHLQPNETYYGPNGAEYHTNEHGLVDRWHAQVSDESLTRNLYAQRTLDGKMPGYHAGHFLAASQGGSGERFNLTVQNAMVNTRDYRAMERENAALYQQGNTVELHGSNSYLRDEVIPDAYMVTREVTAPNGAQVSVDHFSWTNTDMGLYEHTGEQEAAQLQEQFENPGAFVYNEEAGLAVNSETGEVVDCSQSPQEALDVPGSESQGEGEDPGSGGMEDSEELEL